MRVLVAPVVVLVDRRLAGGFPTGSGRPSAPPSGGVAVTSSTSTSSVASSLSAVVATTSTSGASASGRGCRAGARKHCAGDGCGVVAVPGAGFGARGFLTLDGNDGGNL
jgi:hypothetical protein